MASLSSMKSDLNYWKGQVNEENNKISKLKKRRNNVEDVKRALNSVANSNSNDVGKRIRNIGKKMGDSIEYPGKGNQIYAIFSGKEEKGVGSDGNLALADEELQRELNDINGKISNAESNLSTAKNKVSNLKASIAAEERRQYEENLKKAAEKLKNIIS